MAKQAEQTVADEAPVSVEDRIGEKFDRAFFGSDEPEQPETGEPEGEEAKGDEPEAESAEEAKPEEGSEEFVEVDFGGTKYQVPPELKDALMATADYTKKTTEVSQLRKTAELQLKEAALFQEQRKFQESVASDLDNLKMLNAYVEHLNSTTDWTKLDTTTAFQTKLTIERHERDAQKLAQALEAKYADFKAKATAQRESIRKEMGEHLSKTIPQWSDDTKSAIHKFVQDAGYPAQALDGMSALDYQMAWEAMQYRKLKSEAKAVVSKAATPTIKPSARKEMPTVVQDKLNYRKAIKKAASPRERQKLAEDRIAEIFGG